MKVKLLKNVLGLGIVGASVEVTKARADDLKARGLVKGVRGGDKAPRKTPSVPEPEEQARVRDVVDEAREAIRVDDMDGKEV